MFLFYFIRFVKDKDIIDSIVALDQCFLDILPTLSFMLPSPLAFINFFTFVLKPLNTPPKFWIVFGATPKAYVSSHKYSIKNNDMIYLAVN